MCIHSPIGATISMLHKNYVVDIIAAFHVSAPVGGGKLLLAAVLAAVTALPPARAEETAQHLVAAVLAAVAAPPSAGADMSAMVWWDEPLLAALRAAMSVPPLPPGDKPMALPPS